jgi:hypothetical protein
MADKSIDSQDETLAPQVSVVSGLAQRAVPKWMYVGCARLPYVCRGCTNELGGISTCAIMWIWVMSTDFLDPAAFSMPMLTSI